MNEKPTPRTDAILTLIPGGQYCDPQLIADELRPHLQKLERENLTFRAAQKACEDCDAPRDDRIDELERELTAERDLDDRLAETLGGLDWIAASPPQSLVAWKEARK